MIKNSKDYFCIFGGGGARGIAYVGVMQAFQELGLNLKGYAGSSVGSIFAVLTALGYTTEELREIFSKFSIDIFKDFNFDLKSTLAFSKGEIFTDWIKELIESKFYGEKYTKGKMEPVRFRDIEKNLVILSVNLNDSTFKEFSSQKTPYFEVAQAVRASVSMPGLFKPCEFENEIIVDGDLTKSRPLWRLSKNLCPDNCRILELRLEDMQENKKIDNTISFINAVYNTVTGFATDYVIDLYGTKDKFDYIKLNLKGYSVVNFILSKEQKEELMSIGYETTMNYFKKVLPKKRKALENEYYELYLILLKMKVAFDKNNMQEANMSLGELFIYLCEHKKNIDVEVYEEIIKFKNLFQANCKTRKFLFVHKSSIKDKKNLKAELEKLIKILELKTLELKNEI